MSRPTRWATALLCFLAASTFFDPTARAAEEPAEADETPSAEFVEYRFLPDLGQIVISDGLVRGAKAVARLKTRGDELAKRGIFPCVDEDKPRLYRRADELDGRKIETVVLIKPPADEDSDWTRHVVVRVDGRKKVDCSIGYSPDGEVFISAVSIYPEAGTVEVAASDADGASLLPAEELEQLDHRGVITDDTLQPPPEEEPAPEQPGTEKV